MDYIDYYKILGVKKNATQKDIKKAYRKLAAKHHPDKNQGSKVAEEKFKEINEANQVIGNVEKRKQYDILTANREAYKRERANSAHTHQSSRRGGSSSGQRFTFEGDPSDFFEKSGYSSFFDLFSDTADEEAFANQARRQRSTKGQSIEAEMEITLLEAYRGSKRTFDLNGKKMRISIKPGAYNGQRLLLKGKGLAGENKNVTGDLFIILKVLPDNLFQREGNDLISTVNVDLYTAILGGIIEVPTMTGSVKIPIPKGSETGKILRLKGKGMPKYKKDKEYGNLLIKINLSMPKNLTAKEEELFKELQNLRKNGQ